MMNKGFKAANGSVLSFSSIASLAWAPTVKIEPGDLCIIRLSTDNLSATTPTYTCADASGNTWTTIIQKATNATAAAGISGAIFASKITKAIPQSTGTITITYSGAVAAHTAYIETYLGFDITLRSAAVSAAGASAAASVVSGAVNAGDLVIGMTAVETRTAPTAGDTDTLNGAWSNLVTFANSGSGTDNTRVQVNGQYKIPTASGAQTYDNAVTNTDWVAMIAVFQASP